MSQAHPGCLPHRRRTVVTAAMVLVIAPLQAASSMTQQGDRAPWSAGVDSVVRSELARTRVPGAVVAVVKDNRVVHVGAYGIAHQATQQPVTPDMLFRIGSVAKLVTGITLAELARQERVNLHAPLASIDPALASGCVGSVTPHQLLTQTAGWVDRARTHGAREEAALGETMRAVGDSLCFTRPGAVFSYSNPGYAMAAHVIERAGGAGARYAALVRALVLDPLGMQASTFQALEAHARPVAHGHEPDGAGGIRAVQRIADNTVEWAAGFLYSTGPELARLAIALMNDGRIEGKQVLATETVRLVTTGHVPHPGLVNAEETRYGYGLLTGRRGGEVVWQHGGTVEGYRAQFLMLPERKAAVIVLANGEGIVLSRLADAVLAASGVDLPALGFAPPRAPTPAERAQIVGRYAVERTVIEIRSEGEGLLVRQNDVDAPAVLSGADQLVVSHPGGSTHRLTLVRGSDGRVHYLHSGWRAIARIED